MPKLNTLSAALVAAVMLTLPASAGEPGTELKGGPIYKQTSDYSSGGYVSKQYTTQYKSGTSYAYEKKQVPHVKHLTATGKGDIIANNIVCVLHGKEVPCETIPGLADALRAQGMTTLANQLPQVPVQPNLVDCGSVRTAGPCGTIAYTGCGSIQSATPCSAPVHGYAESYATPKRYTPTYQAPVNSGYGPYGSQYYGAQGTTYGSYVETQLPQQILTPCGQVVGVTCGSIAPLSVQLDDGTMYAFGGGVGAGVYGEYYGGGGTLIEGGGSYSGVTEAYGFHYGNSFNYKYEYKGGGKGGKGGGCKTGGGCGGGGKGGGGCTSGCGGGHTGGKGGYHGGKGGYTGGKGGYHGGKGGYTGGKGGKGGSTCGGGCK